MTGINFWQQMGTNACSCLSLWNFLKDSILMESPIWIIYAAVCFTSIDSQARRSFKAWWLYRYCTCLSRDLNEGIYSTFTIIPLWCQSGHIVPAQCLHDVHHSLGLVGVWWYHTREEVIAVIVAQLWCCGGVTDLGDLEDKTRGDLNSFFKASILLTPLGGRKK